MKEEENEKIIDSLFCLIMQKHDKIQQLEYDIKVLKDAHNLLRMLHKLPEFKSLKLPQVRNE